MTVFAGSEHTLVCRVSEISNLVVQPILKWVNPRGHTLGSKGGTSLNITLSSVNTSDAGQYICEAMVNVEMVGVNVENTSSTNLTVKSKFNEYHLLVSNKEIFIYQCEISLVQ